MTVRTALHDATLAPLSDQLDADAVEAAADCIETSIANATISGAGRMVDFEDYNEVRL